VRRAARCAPKQLAPRLEEEWLADLLDRKGHLSRLGFAIGCYWAVRVIAHEHHPVRAAAPASATAGRGATLVYDRFDWALLSRRTVVLLSILALHVLLIYCFATGLARKIVTVIAPPIHVGFIDKPRERPLPPPPAPTLVRPRLDIPKSLVQIDSPPDTSAIREPPTQPQKVALVPSHPSIPVTRVTGGPARGFPNTDDYYPAAARRLGETGSSVVRVCVDARGRLTAAPTIAQSSGSGRLDEGAITLAKAGTGHYRPTTENGLPVPSCYDFRIIFTLRE
jgi:TonB family protein